MKANRVMSNKASSEGKRENLNHLKVSMKPRKMLKDISSETHSNKGKTQENYNAELSGTEKSAVGILQAVQKMAQGEGPGPPILQSLGNCL